jgi:hypothetical protein
MASSTPTGEVKSKHKAFTLCKCLQQRARTPPYRAGAGFAPSIHAARGSRRAVDPCSVLRQLCPPLRGAWALTRSELPWAVPDGPT